MTTSKTIVLAVLAIIAATLAAVSVYAYASAATPAKSTNQLNATTSGTNGYLPGGMGSWGGMMGGGGMMNGYGYSQPSTGPSTTTSQNSILPLVGLTALIGALATGAGGLVYFVSPKMKPAERKAENNVENKHSQDALTPYLSVSRTLTPEELKVFEVLVQHNGKYLQKYIRAETGLSRLKTHRIVSRLAERGIVTLEKAGNTNEVHLSSWLLNPSKPTQMYDEQTRKISVSA